VAKILFTRHAKNRMRWHQITKEQIELTLNSPLKLEHSSEERVNAWKNFGSKALRVTYKQEGDRTIIITAVFKKLRGKK
jgi:hypothetical protein